MPQVKLMLDYSALLGNNSAIVWNICHNGGASPNFHIVSNNHVTNDISTSSDIYMISYDRRTSITPPIVTFCKTVQYLPIIHEPLITVPYP